MGVNDTLIAFRVTSDYPAIAELVSGANGSASIVARDALEAALRGGESVQRPVAASSTTSEMAAVAAVLGALSRQLNAIQQQLNELAARQATIDETNIMNGLSYLNDRFDALSAQVDSNTAKIVAAVGRGGSGLETDTSMSDEVATEIDNNLMASLEAFDDVDWNAF